MNIDSYGEVINGEDTYDETAAYLKVGTPVLLGWTDRERTHLDVLFTYPIGLKRGLVKEGTVQGGIGNYYLFVSIMRIGAFGFKVGKDSMTSSDEYIGEKLTIGVGITTKRLADLINAVRIRL